MPLDSSRIRASSAARRSGVANVPPSISRAQITSARPRAAEITSSIAPRPPERARSSGSWPSGSSAKRRLFPGLRCGSARSAARYAAFWPALSPSKQRIGSAAIFPSSASWLSGHAAPRGAALAAKPGGDIARACTEPSPPLNRAPPLCARGRRTGENLRGETHHVVERLAALPLPPRVGRPRRQRHTGHRRQPLDRLGKTDALGLHQEGNDVAVLARGKVVVKSLLVVDGER